MNQDSMSTSNLSICSYCGAFHTSICPLIREIEYYPNGTIKRVVLARIRPTPHTIPPDAQVEFDGEKWKWK